MFGENASNFSYTKSGNLVYNGDSKGKGLTKDQRKTLKGLNKVIGEKTITNVAFGKSIEITLNDGSTQTVNAADGGGAVTVLVGENPVSENTILIDPNNPNVSNEVSVMAVTPAYYIQPINPANGARFNPQKVKSSTTATIFHEIGHVLEKGNTQDKVLNFENGVRRQIGLPERPHDENHNRTVKKGQYGN